MSTNVVDKNQEAALAEIRAKGKLTPKDRGAIPRQPMPEQAPEVRRHNI